MLQPIVVRRSGGRYELVVGERRWRAARTAGLAKIPAIIADVDERERLVDERLAVSDWRVQGRCEKLLFQSVRGENW